MTEWLRGYGREGLLDGIESATRLGETPLSSRGVTNRVSRDDVSVPRLILAKFGRGQWRSMSAGWNPEGNAGGPKWAILIPE